MIGAFTQQDVIATFFDDSASYLTLARRGEFSGYLSNFPPVLPLLLAVTGGAYELRIAYLLIAVCAVGGLAVVYFFVAHERGPRVGLFVALFFLFSATAWVSLKGVLSEAPYLLASMGALLFYEKKREHVVWFGVLMAVAYLTRTIGVALIVGYAVHLAIRYAGRDRPAARAWLAFVPVVVLAGLWYLLRPQADVDNYRRLASSVSSWWLKDPLNTFEVASYFFVNGWVRSFMADHHVSVAAHVVFGVFGLVALAGMVRRLLHNRLDAWFTLFSLAAVFVWTFSADASARLMYPFVPLLIFYAVDFLLATVLRERIHTRNGKYIAALVAAVPIVLSLPAFVTVMQKGLDRRPVIAGCGYQYRHFWDYYTILNQGSAEKLAQVQAAMLCGMQALRTVTPPDAVVMWSRPEYIAVMSDRRGVPLMHRWPPRELAEEVRRSGTDYVLDTDLFKNDLAGGKGRTLEQSRIGEYTRPVFLLGGGVFVVRQVDRAALDRFLAPG